MKLSKIQKEVNEIKLRPIKIRDIDMKRCFEDAEIISYRTNCYCTECGQYLGKKKDVLKKDENIKYKTSYLPAIKKCPTCKSKLKRHTEQTKTAGIILIVQKSGNWNVYRRFFIYKTFHAGKPAEYFNYGEVSQQWYDGKNLLEREQRLGIFPNYRLNPYSASYSGEMIFKKGLYLNEWSYARVVSCNQYLRMATKYVCEGSSIEIYKRKIETDSYYETLIKMGKIELAKQIDTESMRKFRNSIRIALKNNYDILQWDTYRDYLNLLEYFHKDLNSPHYLCPDNFRKEHDKLTAKRQKAYEEQRKRNEILMI